MSAKAGWYPDPGGGQGLYRYWDGKSWSAATSPNPGAPPPNSGLGAVGQPTAGSPFGQTTAQTMQPGLASGHGRAPGGYGQGAPAGYGQGNPNAYANYQQIQKKKSPVGWWIGGIALVVVIVVIAVIAIRAVAGGNTDITSPPGGGPVVPGRLPAAADARPRSPRPTPTTAGCTAARSPTRPSVRPGVPRSPTTGFRSAPTC